MAVNPQGGILSGPYGGTGESLGGGFLGSLGSLFSGGPVMNAILGGLGGLFGGQASAKALKQGREDVLNLPGMDGPVGFGTGFGFTDQNGLNSPMLSGNMMGLTGAATPLLQGGLFNAPGLQSAMQGLNLSGALGQAQGAFGTQMGPSAFGGMGGLYNQASQLGGLFSNQAMMGPQDLTGGLQGGLFGAGMANQMSAMNQSGLQAQELAALRAAAAPEQNRMFNSLQDRLFAQGRLGSTGGAENMRALFEAQNQQDLGFQTEAFNRAMQQQGFLGNLGSQQISQGAGLLGQNLGQFNQTAANAQNFLGLGAGLEGQAFGQNLQSIGQNQAAALQNLQAQQGLFGFGNDLFASQFGLGLGAMDAFTGLGALGLNAGRAPWELQAGLLSGGGQHADALSKIATAKRGGGFLGGLFSDRRLKDNLQLVGSRNGINWYTWDWNDTAFEVGASNQPCFGVVADEVEEVMPEAVFTINGYKQVNYDMILEAE